MQHSQFNMSSRKDIFGTTINILYCTVSVTVTLCIWSGAKSSDELRLLSNKVRGYQHDTNFCIWWPSADIDHIEGYGACCSFGVKPALKRCCLKIRNRSTYIDTCTQNEVTGAAAAAAAVVVIVAVVIVVVEYIDVQRFNQYVLSA